MAKTKDGKRDLEAEVIDRCVKAIKLEGRRERGQWMTQVTDNGDSVARVLRYLAARFGVEL